MGVPSNHPTLDHFSVENHGFADPTISETPICICLSGFFMPVPRGSTIAATTAPQLLLARGRGEIAMQQPFGSEQG